MFLPPCLSIFYAAAAVNDATDPVAALPLRPPLPQPMLTRFLLQCHGIDSKSLCSSCPFKVWPPQVTSLEKMDWKVLYPTGVTCTSCLQYQQSDSDAAAAGSGSVAGAVGAMKLDDEAGGER